MLDLKVNRNPIKSKWRKQTSMALAWEIGVKLDSLIPPRGNQINEKEIRQN